jgi:hypothetical protein
MSHFTRIRTQIREREHLAQALRDLHYQFQEGENLVVRGYMGGQERAEVVVNTGSNYDIGFQRKAEEYEVVADWWGVQGNTRIRQQTFVEQVSRQYAYNLIKAQAREEYLLIEEEQELENGDRVLILSERG